MSRRLGEYEICCGSLSKIHLNFAVLNRLYSKPRTRRKRMVQERNAIEW